MALAVRVLTALNLGETPAPADVAELKTLEPLLADTAPLDELACEVIQQSLKRRAEIRESQRTTMA